MNQIIDNNTELTNEELVAIGTALFMLQNELRDKEHAILTHQTRVRYWTPWNAKYYSMNRYFEKK